MKTWRVCIGVLVIWGCSDSDQVRHQTNAVASSQLLEPAGNGVAATGDYNVTPGTYRRVAYLPNKPVGIGALSESEAGERYVIEPPVNQSVTVTHYSGRNIKLGAVVYKWNGQAPGSVIERRHTDRFNTLVKTELDTLISAGHVRRESRLKSLRNPETPCSRQKIKRTGTIERITCLDGSGRPRPDSERVVTWESTHLTDGAQAHQPSSKRALGNAGQAILSTRGFHQIKYAYDANGCLIERRYLGVNGEPTLDKSSLAHLVKFKRNRSCNILEKEHFAIDERPTRNAANVFKTVYEVADGLILKESHFGSDNLPTVDSNTNAHTTQNTYDRRGNQLSARYFDTNNQPMNRKGGYHKALATIDNDMMQTFAYFDVKGRPAVDKSSLIAVHKIFYIRDEYGQPTLSAYYGKNGKPVKDQGNQVRMVKTAYDTFGRVIEESYWRAEGKPMNRWDGYHKHRNTYGNDGLLRSRRYFDKNDRPKTVGGASKHTFSYNERGKDVSDAYFRGATPVKLKGNYSVGGYHRIERTVDDLDRVMEIPYLGPDGGPIGAELAKVHRKVHRVKFRYDGDRLVEQQIFGVGSQVPLRTLDCETDVHVTPYGNNTTEP